MFGKRERQKWDWPQLRDWCIKYLELFLEHADDLDCVEGWTRYREASNALPELHWKDLKAHPNQVQRDIAERVIRTVDEGADKKVALPGMFSDTVAGANKWLRLLNGCDNADLIYQQVCEIDDSI